YCLKVGKGSCFLSQRPRYIGAHFLHKSMFLKCDKLMTQWSPTFFAPGTDFKQDHFFMARQGEMGVGQGRGCQCLVLVCGGMNQQKNPQRPGSGPWTGGWGPLH
uniref:Uncharacterized protein n=1 Tax=Salvator merianae TaxID=96440 RepID=A0A8D0DIZ7_SALMN